MKKISSIFLLLFSISLLPSCDINKKDYEGEYYMFNGSSDEELFEDYFNIEDTKTKIFTNQEDYDAFNSLMDDTFEYFEKVPFEVDFSNYNVAITATYVNHSSADIEVKSIKIDGTKITQKIKCTINIPAVSPSSYGFLYVLIEKGIDYLFVTDYETSNNYDQTLCYKPIIYFYPNEDINLQVKYVKEENLLTTYPKYDNGWNLNIKKDGTFTCNDSNREYYALYFDEFVNYTCDFNEGFYVTSENAISFLEEKLDILGYTNKESNECIMYWLPILEENGQSLVYFEQTKLRNNNCPLEFSINPDSMLRTIIHIKKVDEFININEQELKSFERVGFSVVEWGGIIY